MIPVAYITEWSQYAPWIEGVQIEQDLLLSRCLVEIYNNPFLKERLAFRGGTALHKLYLQPQARYSEDIDLVQISAEPIKETLKVLRSCLDFLGKPSVKQKRNNNTLIYRVDSEFELRIRIKVEINCREHFSVYDLVDFPFEVDSSWFKGKAVLSTYSMEELLATKLRALYQRRKGRDLFDLWHAMNSKIVDCERVLNIWRHYLQFEGNSISKKQFQQNLATKMKDAEFATDIQGLLRPSISYDSQQAYEMVRDQLIALME